MGVLTAIMAFFSSTFGKIVFYLGAGLLVFGILATSYTVWEHKVQEAEKYKIENAQLQNSIKALNKTVDDQKVVIKKAEETSTWLSVQKNAIDETSDSVNLDISAMKDDPLSSDVLKNTFRKLYPEPKKELQK
jgi:hypothetical protein